MFNGEKTKANQTELAHITLRTVTAKTEIIYDPTPDTTIIEEDKEFVDVFFAIPEEFSSTTAALGSSRWCRRTKRCWVNNSCLLASCGFMGDQHNDEHELYGAGWSASYVFRTPVG